MSHLNAQISGDSDSLEDTTESELIFAIQLSSGDTEECKAPVGYKNINQLQKKMNNKLRHHWFNFRQDDRGLFVLKSLFCVPIPEKGMEMNFHFYKMYSILKSQRGVQLRNKASRSTAAENMEPDLMVLGV